MTTAVLLVFLGALSRLLPHPPNAVALGAVALYAGARLPRHLAFAVPLAAMALSDFFLDVGTGRSALSFVRLADYAAFAAIVGIGRARGRAARPLGLAGLSVAGSVLFFLASNAAVWLSDGLYAKTPSGLALCFAAAIPFLGSTLAADLAGTAVLFGADTLSRRRTRTSASFLAAAAVLLALLPAAAHAQQPVPPVSEDVVVTATSIPAQETQVGSAVTVITRQEIERSEKGSVLELLRAVAGLDVVQSGPPGSVTSLFTRGTNSTQTLVLVDGVRMNSPFFAGYDWSAMTTENIERIEIVRGPFSALYGSDAIGGVVQIFTRTASEGISGRATGEAGNQGQGQGSAFVSGGEGTFFGSGAYRYVAFDGDRPNTDWRQRTGEARVEARLSEGSRIAFEGGIIDGEVGNPGPVGLPSTARGLFREERLALPGSFALSDANQLDVLVADVRSKPGYRDVDGGFVSQTDAQTLQTRVSDTQHLGAHALTAFASWERWKVDDASNFGVNLDGQRTTLWGLGAQDTATFGAFTVTAGVRYDRHSTFGDHWSPRATVLWLSPGALWKIRASGGSGYRAPTIGELYYPFGANPNLKPESSISWEVGAERYVGGGRVEVSFFWNDLKDLIVYDFATSTNENVGRARTKGVEVGWRQTIVAALSADVTYTYLEAVNRDTGAALIRRPRHRASLGLDWRPIAGFDVAGRLLFTGDRPDNDPLTGAPTELPSFLRLDLLARYQATPNLAPYLRLTNALDRQYDEAAGYPAAGRLVAGGLDVRF
ncbi:MAG TPA: TonB-dependent receptor [Thermoanaerobaculia bacterium]|jgi:vitamin B12 transporter